MTEESGSINLKELGKRAFSYFGGLSKNEVKRLVNYAMIIEGANHNLKGALTTMSTKLKEALDEIGEIKQEASDRIRELEKHISELNARIEEKENQRSVLARWIEQFKEAMVKIDKASDDIINIAHEIKGDAVV